MLRRAPQATSGTANVPLSAHDMDATRSKSNRLECNRDTESFRIPTTARSAAATHDVPDARGGGGDCSIADDSEKALSQQSSRGSVSMFCTPQSLHSTSGTALAAGGADGSPGLLFIGTFADAMTLSASIPVKISAVVSCLVERNDALDAHLAADAVAHHYFFVDDIPSTEERAKYSHRNPQALEAVAFIHSHLERGENVYVHCEAGRTRSAGLVILYLILARHWTYARALAVLQGQRQVHVKALEPYLRHASHVTHNTSSPTSDISPLHSSKCGRGETPAQSPPSRSFTPMNIDLHLPNFAAQRGEGGVAAMPSQLPHIPSLTATDSFRDSAEPTPRAGDDAVVANEAGPASAVSFRHE